MVKWTGTELFGDFGAQGKWTGHRQGSERYPSPRWVQTLEAFGHQGIFDIRLQTKSTATGTTRCKAQMFTLLVFCWEQGCLCEVLVDTYYKVPETDFFSMCTLQGASKTQTKAVWVRQLRQDCTRQQTCHSSRVDYLIACIGSRESAQEDALKLHPSPSPV